jgi:hypothetical protein
LSSVTVAPGTTAPDGSFTTPRSEVVAFCAKLIALQQQKKKTTAKAPMRLIKSFLLGDNSLICPSMGINGNQRVRMG